MSDGLKPGVVGAAGTALRPTEAVRKHAAEAPWDSTGQSLYMNFA